MKNYLRTYDVYKLIAEEGKTRFRRNRDNEIYYWDKYHRRLRPESADSYKTIDLDELWKEVKKPATFMEIVKNSYDFRVEHKHLKGTVYDGNLWNLNSFLEILGTEFCDVDIRPILIEGKFYIED